MQTETSMIEEVKADWIIGASNMSAQLSVTLTDFLSSKLYSIQISKSYTQKFVVERKIYYITPYNFSFPYQNTKTDKKTIEATKS